MFLASLPFDYAKLVGPGDRVRTRCERTTDSRFRRTNPRGDA